MWARKLVILKCSIDRAHQLTNEKTSVVADQTNAEAFQVRTSSGGQKGGCLFLTITQRAKQLAFEKTKRRVWACVRVYLCAWLFVVGIINSNQLCLRASSTSPLRERFGKGWTVELSGPKNPAIPPQKHCLL